tara:strand:- start:2 stop:181 length:180 start_codon:yes stop_codon:yes gene_type:complete
MKEKILTKKEIKNFFSYLWIEASLIIHSIKFKKEILLNFAISGTSDSSVIPGCVFISKR